MDYLNTIRDLIEKLKENDFIEEAEKLKFYYQTSFTSTELLLKTLFNLKNICKQESNIASLLSKDLIEFESFCNSIGIFSLEEEK